MDYIEESSCGFSESLVSYLYGEITPSDSRAFERHLNSCETCREEFSGFNRVHDSILVWRDSSLALEPPASLEVQSTLALDPWFPKRERSAIAALREFFTLSPMWLRGATAVAVILFCALVLFTGKRLLNNKADEQKVAVSQQVSPIPAPSVASPVPSREVTSVGPKDIAQNGNRNPVPNKQRVSAPVHRHNVNSQQFEADLNRKRTAPTDVKSEQILSDLGLTSTREDERAPRLSDVVSERDWNN